MKLYKCRNKPALPVLIIVFLVASLQLVNNNLNMYSLSKFSAVIALPFWLWALFNNINNIQDFGVISFGSVLLTFVKCHGYLGNKPNKNLCKNLFIMSSSLVSVNYLLALCLKNTPYHLIATILWISITLLFINNN